jgi:hypothetical protein
MKNIFLCIIAAIALVSCKVDVDNTAKINEVEFTIRAEDDSLAKNARIFIYDTEASYLSDYQKGDTNSTALAISKNTASNGKITTKLAANKAYWIRVVYFQDVSKTEPSALIGGVQMYSNDEETVKFGPFENNDFGTENLSTKATIRLTKAYSFLAITAKDSSNIKVYNSENKIISSLGGRTNLTTSGSSSDVETDKNLLSITNAKYLLYKVPKGKISVSYKSKNGCAGVNTITIQGKGEIVKEELTPCDAGTIVFYNNSSDLKDIKVILLAASDTLGTISSKNTGYTDATVCDLNSNESLIKVGRAVGTYNYLLTSASGPCEVKGTVEVSKNGCVRVPINLCR